MSRIPFSNRGVVRNVLFRSPIAGVGPIVGLLGDVREVGHFDSNANIGMSHFGQVSEDALGALEVSLSWSGPESGHRHHGSMNVKSSNLHDPL